VSRDIWTVLPVRGIERGKSRLAPFLDEAARAKLMRWLLTRTFSVLTDWYGDLSRCIVVSRCAEVYGLARAAGAEVICEIDAVSDQNRTAELGAEYAFDRGAPLIMALPSDLPELDASSLDALVLAAKPSVDMVVVPDAAGSGTNAVVYRANPRAIPARFHFGPRSCPRYVAWAADRGLSFAVLPIPGITFDLDTPDDLTAWIARCGGPVPWLDPAVYAAASSQRDSRHATA
jgi:2-phospho-L-lactate/phosphoenolpyruvate guanylyltransferase